MNLLSRSLIKNQAPTGSAARMHGIRVPLPLTGCRDPGKPVVLRDAAAFTLDAYTADVSDPDHPPAEQITGLFARQPVGDSAVLTCPDRAMFTDPFTGHLLRGVQPSPTDAEGP